MPSEEKPSGCSQPQSQQAHGDASESPKTQLVAERHQPPLSDQLRGHNSARCLLVASRGIDLELDLAGFVARTTSSVRRSKQAHIQHNVAEHRIACKTLPGPEGQQLDLNMMSTLSKPVHHLFPEQSNTLWHTFSRKIFSRNIFNICSERARRLPKYEGGNCCGAEEHTSPIPKNSSVNEEPALHQAVCRTPSSTESTA